MRVSVYAEHHAGNLVYKYEVRNNGPGELRAFYIGCDCPLRRDEGVAQLHELPPGAQPAAAAAAGSHIDIPATATTQPPGWRVQLLRPRNSNNHWLAWRMPAARANAGLGSGQNLSGFSITVPQADRAYLDGNYSAHVLHNGRYLVLTAPLTLLDTTPPSLSLQALPVGANSAAGSVRIRASAKDDRDPEPRVAVESLERLNTAAPGQRRYVVSYSATDASGNRSIASTTVISSEAPALPAPAPTPIRMPMVQAQANLPTPEVLP